MPMFKAEKIRFGFEKEMNRQLRMIVQTYINKRSVTDKGTFYGARVMKEFPTFIILK